jgi:hypothetical protein
MNVSQTRQRAPQPRDAKGRFVTRPRTPPLTCECLARLGHDFTPIIVRPPANCLERRPTLVIDVETMRPFGGGYGG